MLNEREQLAWMCYKHPYVVKIIHSRERFRFLYTEQIQQLQQMKTRSQTSRICIAVTRFHIFSIYVAL
jgi:hypothetical protein